jgi:glucuronoarabinoxylan endo-1,4-beta-xylanase
MIFVRLRISERALRLLAALTLFQAGTIFAQNLAQNPGFETGTTSGWSPFGSTSISAQAAQVRSGNYAGRVDNRSATWHGIAQSLTALAQPNQTYNLSVWVRLVSGANQTVQFTIKKTDSSGDSYAAIASASVSQNAWTQLSGQYILQVSGTLSGLTCYIESPSSATASFYVDDLMVEAASPPGGTPGEARLYWNTLRQQIDGFGASSAWRSQWTATQADILFSTNNGTGTARDGTTFPFTGVGLSLLRSRITPSVGTWELSIMQMAQSRGAKVWSAPWSPPATYKDSGNVNGGNFLSASNVTYANDLATYVLNMKNNGVNLYAISIQNEPDHSTTQYESCVWTAEQIRDFVPHLYNALSNKGVASTKIMLPEGIHWPNTNLFSPALNDSSIAPMVGIIANHNYDGVSGGPPTAVPVPLRVHGKPLWQTEVSKLTGSDSSIDDALYWAERIHLFLTVPEVNAWHYWWLISGNSTSNQGLMDTNAVPAKRMYTLGNFSRFVRPGFHRIGTTNTGTSLISAYRNVTNGAFAVVAINAATNAVTQSFRMDGFSANSVTPWITSESFSLSNQAPVPVTNFVFTYSLPARSVVSFVGAGNTAPTLSPVANRTVNPGTTVTVTNAASDPEIAAQSLTFELLASPPGASVNATNGVFTWRPGVSQANSNHFVTVRVSDNGTPPLSATNSFQVLVNPAVVPTLSVMATAPPELLFSVSGAPGPDYTIWTSTNLLNWQALFTTNPATLPFTFTDTTTTGQKRFYRIQLGP